MSDPRDYQRGIPRLSPDQGSLQERQDELDGSLDDADCLEESAETGFFPHDA